MKRFLLALFSVVCCLSLKAQLSAEAGGNAFICKGKSVPLGGNPTATGNNPPFTYQWFPATGLSSATVATPVATPLVTTTYYVTVTDNTFATQVDSVIVQVTNKYNLRIQVSDTLICAGQQIQLGSNLSTGCLTALTASNLITPVIGNDSIAQPGNLLQPPSLFGNYVRSSRSQMLYKAAELQAALGGPNVIKAITFGLRVFNSNAFLQNFSVKIGCTSKDSLVEWDNNLTQVFSSGAFQPQMGWFNGIALTTPIYWDGVSNLIVDVCNYNPATFGNQVNKAACSITPFKSYLFSWGSTNQCDSAYAPSVYNLRPNIKFNYGNPIATPTHINNPSVNFNWSPSTGAGQVSDTHSPSPNAAPVSSTWYVLQVSDTSGCAESDSVLVHVQQPTTSVQTTVFDKFCFSAAGGAITAVLNTTLDSISYTLFNANYSNTLYSGVTADNATYQFTNLPQDTYHLVLSDSICVTDYPVMVSSFPQLINAPTTLVSDVKCYGDSNGSVCINVSGGTPPYRFFWDSTAFHPACYDSLAAGLHQVLIIDSNNCTKQAPNVIVYQADSSLYAFVTYISPYSNGYLARAYLSGGGVPYSINWGDSTMLSVTGSTTVGHIFYSTGTYTVTITDFYGCVVTDTVEVIYNSIDDVRSNSKFSVYPNPTSNTLTVLAENLHPLSISVFNTDGKKISDQKYASQIDVSLLTSGIYFIELKGSDGIARRKFVKM